MKRIIILLLVFLLFLFRCKKDDININGNVLNIGTGNGFSNVEVQLIEAKEKTFSTNPDIVIWYTTSNTNGNFSFQDIPFNYNEKYSYSLYIKSWSTKETEFFGTGASVEKYDLSNNYLLMVSITFYQFLLYLPENTEVIPPDTFSVVLEQRTKHYFRPNLNWRWETNSSRFTPIGHDRDYFGPTTMGWWHITFDKTKSGVHSVIYDSIYMDMGETKTYILPW